MKLILVLAAFFLIGCVEEEVKDELVYPITNKCSNEIEVYRDKLSSLGWDVAFERVVFSEEIPPFKDVVGYVKIYSNERPDKLDIVVNGIKLLCYPSNYFYVDKTYEGALEAIERVSYKSADVFYMHGGEKDISVYYYGVDKGVREGILK